MNFIHADLPEPWRMFVQEKVLFDMDPEKTGILPCRVFAISSYPEQTLSFTIEVRGAIFSDIPPHLLTTTNFDNPLDLRDLCYHHNPSGRFVIIQHRFLRAKGFAWCFFKKRDLWLQGEYQFTIDWYEDNLLAHLVILRNGQVAAVPSHKIMFRRGKKPPKLPEYKKLKHEWVLGNP